SASTIGQARRGQQEWSVVTPAIQAYAQVGAPEPEASHESPNPLRLACGVVGRNLPASRHTRLRLLRHLRIVCADVQIERPAGGTRASEVRRKSGGIVALAGIRSGAHRGWPGRV